MPINTAHPLYTEMASKWTRCHHAYAGEDAVKAENITYLPKLSSMTGPQDERYVAYKARAMFYGATARTVETLVGMAVSKPPRIELPPKLQYLLDDANGMGVTLMDMMKQTITEMFLTAREGILVDRAVEGSPPYLAAYSATSITNWNVDHGKLNWLVLHEPQWTADAADPYKQTQVDAYRLLGFDNEGSYFVQVHTRTGEDKYAEGPMTYPTKRGQQLPYIPFVPVTPVGSTYDICKPPLLDMINVNLAHYRNSADLEHGRHFTALPTPWFSGMSEAIGENGEPNTTIEIGSESAILIPAENGRAGYLEFTGAGLRELREGMREKENMMAVLGARVLEQQKKAAESAETTRLNKLNDNSVLASIVGSVERAYVQAIEMAAEWEGVTGNVEIEFNKDALDLQVSPQMLAALISARQANQLSYESYFNYLQQGGLIDETRTIEEELDAILTSAPLLPSVTNITDEEEEEADVDGA